MSNTYYRIRVNELNNGDKMYVPERSVLEVNRGWFQRQRIYWEPLTYKDCETEEDAMAYIQAAKDSDERKHARQVKSTTFKEIK